MDDLIEQAWKTCPNIHPKLDDLSTAPALKQFMASKTQLFSGHPPDLQTMQDKNATTFPD